MPILTSIPDSWGPKLEMGGSAIAHTSTRPGQIAMHSTYHTALLMLTPQANRELSLNSDRSAPRNTLPGALEILPANSDIFSRWTMDKQNLLFAISEESLKDIARSEFGSDQVELIPKPDGVSDRRLMALGSMVRTEMLTSAGAFDQLLLEALSSAFWIYLLRDYSNLSSREARTPKGGLTPRTLRRVEEFMQENLSSRIRIEDLARVAGLSSSHFMRAFRETCNKTVNQRLTEHRLTSAMAMINNSDRSLEHIARLCGFGTNSYMTTVMHRKFLITPSELRRGNLRPDD